MSKLSCIIGAAVLVFTCSAEVAEDSGKCPTSVVTGVGYTGQGHWYNTTHGVAQWKACCALCSSDDRCKAWTHHSHGALCSLAVSVSINSKVSNDTTSGSKVPVPGPTPTAPTPPPTPTAVQPLGPARAGSPNIILFLTDDQDILLGGWTPLQQTSRVLSERGASATHWTVHTPVCCPSRTQLLTGRYFHNVKTA